MLLADSYDVRIIPRDGMGQINDDWHATVTRRSDGKQLVFIARYRWLIDWKTRREALDRHYRYADKRDAKMARVEERIR